jgi:hypothetical protein
MNTKYNLNFKKNILDNSEINKNSWFTGFIESNGHFEIKKNDFKPKSSTRKRSRSSNASLVFKLDQRSFDRPTSSVMFPIMEKIANFLFCNLLTVKRYPTWVSKVESINMLTVEISAVQKIEILINYLNKYPLLGIKQLDFNDWKLVYDMIKNKEHLTEAGRIKIKSIKSNMNTKRQI